MSTAPRPYRKPSFDIAGERAMGPGGLVAGRHHVGMAGKGDVRGVVADARIEIVDVGGAGFAEGDAMRLETRWLSAGLRARRARRHRRGHRWAAERSGQWRGHRSCPRLTCHAAMGQPVGNNFQLAALVPARPRIARSSGSGPNRLVLREPFRQNISTKPQMQSTKAIRASGRSSGEFGQPVAELVEETGGHKERQHPPAALVAVRAAAVR